MLNSVFAVGLFSLGMLAGFLTARQPNSPDPAQIDVAAGSGTSLASIVPLPDLDALVGGEGAEPQGVPMHEGSELSLEELEGLEDPSLEDAVVAADPILPEEAPILGPELPPGFEHSIAEEEHFEAPVALDVVVAGGEIGAGESLSRVMNAAGVSAATIQWINDELREIYDFRKARPGHRFRILQSRAGEILDFRYQHGRKESIHLQATKTGYRIVLDNVGIDEAPDPLIALAELQRASPTSVAVATEPVEAVESSETSVEPASATEPTSAKPILLGAEEGVEFDDLELAVVVPAGEELPAPTLADRTAHYVPASISPSKPLATRLPSEALASLHEPPRQSTPESSSESLPFWRGDTPGPGQFVIEGKLGRGQTLSQALRAKGVSAANVHRIDRAARPVFDFRTAQPGHRFRLTTNPQGEIVRFRYRLSSDLAVQLMPVDGPDGKGTTLVATRIESPMRAREARIVGTVESTLYDAIAALGEDPMLAEAFANIFAWELDFARNVQVGDQFQILYEREYWVDPDGRERFAQLGKILAASFRGRAGSFEAVHYEPDREASAAGARAGYYRPDGTAIERQFLAAPLEYSRIASRYTSSRFHPILKVNRPHHGIDYAAPRGTPVWAVASGKVVYRARAGSFGNLVKIEHRNGLISYYTHLQGFAKGLRVGDTVRQKTVIGYVGSTGLATGPHVCFRVTKNGRYVNPLRVESPEASPIPASVKARFEQRRAALMSRLAGATVLAMESR